MSTPQIDPQLASEVAQIKRMTIQRNVRAKWQILFLFSAAAAAGLGTWFSAQPINRDDIHGGLAMGLGLATFLFGGLLCRFLYPIPDAECPQCGCDWNSESKNDIHKWLQWECCPGCGLKMTDD